MPTCRKGEVVGGLISIFGDIHFYIVLTEYNEYLYSSSKLTRDYQISLKVWKVTKMYLLKIIFGTQTKTVQFKTLTAHFLAIAIYLRILYYFLINYAQYS